MIILYYFIEGDKTIRVRALVDDYEVTEALCECATEEYARYLVDRLNSIAEGRMREIQASVLLDLYLR